MSMSSSTMRKKLVGRNNCELPEEIWRMILLYLTAKDLHSCKTVSKLWYSLISNPNFVTIHLNLIRSHQQEILVTTTAKPNQHIPYYQFDYYSIINNDLIRLKDLQYPYHNQLGTTTTPTPAMALSLQASCDGLLLLQDKYDPKQLYISNPVTRQFKPLPSFTRGHICRHWVLVRDTLIDKYKVFGITSQDQFTLLTVGGLTPGHWKFSNIESSKHLPFFYVSSQIFLFQNELHWLTIDHEDDDHGFLTSRKCYCIYTVNVQTAIFNKIKIPNHVVKLCDLFQFLKCNVLHLLSEVKGSLCLTTVSKSKLDMFVLEDRLKNVWTKSHAICLQSLSKLRYSLNSFWSDDICLVAVRDVDTSNLLDLVKVLIHREGKVLIYDLKSQECREIGFLEKGQKLSRRYLFHSNSLVSWDSAKPFLSQCCKMLPLSYYKVNS